jgi:hypothetical protein
VSLGSPPETFPFEERAFRGRGRAAKFGGAPQSVASVGSPTLASRRRQPGGSLASPGGTTPAARRKLAREARAACRFAGGGLSGATARGSRRHGAAGRAASRGGVPGGWLVDRRGLSDMFPKPEKNKLFAVFGALSTLPSRRGGAGSPALRGGSTVSFRPHVGASMMGIAPRGGVGGGACFEGWCGSSSSIAHCGVQSARRLRQPACERGGARVGDGETSTARALQGSSTTAGPTLGMRVSEETAE